jgi:spermidine synthase
VWVVGYGLFVLLSCLSVIAGWRRRRLDGSASASPVQRRPQSDTARLSWRRRVTWIALAFVPSSLMLAVTTYFSTDIAPVPLFWIVPLSLYLLTFVMVFSRRLASWRSVANRFMPILILPLVLLMMANASVPLWLAMPLHLTAFVMAAIVCHGRLADDRPGPAHLTEFYLWIAFGGMMGGVFNTLVAPLLFNTVAEYPIVLVLACAARQGRPSRASNGHLPLGLNDLVAPVAVGTLTALSIVVLHPSGNAARLLVAGLGLPAFIAFTQSRAPVRFAASIATMLVAGTIALNAQRPALYLSRTFFGVYRVSADPEHRYHALFHGTTLHGLQAVDPARQQEPLTYYHRNGPMGQAFAALPFVASASDIAVVGLGAGALASYRTPAQRWTFYEIDPEVERIARTPGYFTYLSACGAQCRVVLGDARLSLMEAQPQQYGLIVLDAFSSDAIPTHLLTAEALSLYLSRLRPNGALAFHITNRHLSLAPVLARLAESFGLAARTEYQVTGTAEQLPSEWMVMARQPDDLGSLTSDPRWRTPSFPPSTPLWTDDFSNILSVLNLRLR